MLMTDWKSLAPSLARIAGGDAVSLDEPLSRHTTFKVGGPADLFVRPNSVQGVGSVIALCREAGAPVRVMGLGSNLLVADGGVRGVVVQIADNMADVSVAGKRVKVLAGASNSSVAHAALAASLAGYEFASGIPGTVGGAAIMNAGAYDGEFRGVAVGVSCLTPDGNIVEVPAAEADWSYRHSMMSDRGYVVLSAELELASGERSAIKARMADLAQRRRDKQPLEMPSAGSTFKRPVGHFAGKLIQDAGLRGFRIGGAQVSEKHTGFVVNAGGATASDVRRLIAEVQRRVKDEAGVRLETEVRMWGFDDVPDEGLFRTPGSCVTGGA